MPLSIEGRTVLNSFGPSKGWFPAAKSNYGPLSSAHVLKRSMLNEKSRERSRITIRLRYRLAYLDDLRQAVLESSSVNIDRSLSLPSEPSRSM